MKRLQLLLKNFKIHTHRWMGFVVGLSLIMTSDSWSTTKTESGRPNILVILADDLGINDLGSYGNSEVNTPNIDRLAETGFRFTRFYTAGDVCAPTRASLFTGLYPQRLSFRHGTLRGLSQEVITLPELLREAGYVTHHVGKWHLGHAHEQALPLAQGCDSFFGFLYAKFLQPPLRDRLRPPTYKDPLLINDGGKPTQRKGHLTDLLTDRAVKKIQESDSAQPWFMNLWYFAPHGPIQPPARWAERYPKTPQGKYYALVSTLDEGIGRVLGALEESGQLNNTIILFLSDNGPTADSAPSNYPFLGTKAEYFEGSVRVPLIVCFPDSTPGAVVNTVVFSNDLYPTIATLTGLQVEHHVDGRDLTALFDKPSGIIQEQPLFWESFQFAPPWGVEPAYFPSSPETLAPGFDFSVLTTNGRWRLTKENGGIALFDLVADPTGHLNVMADYPSRVNELVAMYCAWAWETRRIGFRAIARGEADWDGEVVHLTGGEGRLDLLGRDMLRTPGFKGWTFAVGVQPDSAVAGHQVIARQEGAWSLTIDSDGNLTCKMADQTLTAPGPARGTCTAVVMTSFFPGGKQQSKEQNGVFDLYVDGTQVGEQGVQADIPLDVLKKNTFLGNGSEFENGFVGTLYHPMLLNARLNPDEVAELTTVLCNQ